MLVAVGSNTFADNLTAIIDGPCDRQYFEITCGEIAKEIEVIHLALRVKECVLGTIADS